jgi:hypothetical protein
VEKLRSAAGPFHQLEETALQFLLERARLEQLTSYTETNTVLAQRTCRRGYSKVSLGRGPMKSVF